MPNRKRDRRDYRKKLPLVHASPQPTKAYLRTHLSANYNIPSNNIKKIARQWLDEVLNIVQRIDVISRTDKRKARKLLHALILKINKGKYS